MLFYRNGQTIYLKPEPGMPMGTQLNIKGKLAHELASQLAALTGESLTTVVTRALQAELDRQRQARDVDAKVARMMAAAQAIRAHLHTPITSDHGCLYDADGFPR